MFKDNADAFSKGILTDIMEPIMGNGLIPAPKEVWAARRPTVGAGFHGAWLKHVGCHTTPTCHLERRVAHHTHLSPRT